MSMLTTLPRGYDRFPFGSLLLFIHIMYFHFPFTAMGLDLGWTKGPRTVSLHLVHLLGNNSIKTYSPMHKKIVSTCSHNNKTV